jgi:hypothetical protein
MLSFVLKQEQDFVSEDKIDKNVINQFLEGIIDPALKRELRKLV